MNLWPRLFIMRLCIHESRIFRSFKSLRPHVKFCHSHRMSFLKRFMFGQAKSPHGVSQEDGTGAQEVDARMLCVF